MRKREIERKKGQGEGDMERHREMEGGSERGWGEGEMKREEIPMMSQNVYSLIFISLK